MIQVNVLLYPKGNVLKAEALGTVKIWNNLTGTDKLGNYGYEIRGKNDVLMNRGLICGFPRKKKHVMELLKQVLDGYYG